MLSPRLTVALALFFLFNVPYPSSAQTGAQSTSIVSKFFQVAGWGQAMTIQTAIATGTVDMQDGTGPHPVIIKISRTGKFRTDISDLNTTVLATYNGATAIVNGKRTDANAGQGTQLATTALVPIFSPLAEVGVSSDVLASLYSSNGTQSTLSIAKSWAIGDGLDAVRTKSGLLQATFDTTTCLLQSVSTKVAFDFDVGNIPVRQTVYSDYRWVGTPPILLPFSIKEYLGKTLISSTQLNAISLNAVLTDADFTVVQQ